MMKILNLFLLLVISCFLCNAQNIQIYVSKSPNPNQDGSIDNPYQSLTDAFDYLKRDTSNAKEYIISIAPAAEAYELTKSYKFELQTLSYKITMKKWINATLPEGQPDDLPRVNFTNASLQFINISSVRFESLNVVGDKGSILLNSTELQLNTLVFEEEFGTDVTPFITVNNARIVEMNNLDIKVTFYKTLVYYLVTEESLDPLIIMNKIHYTIETHDDLHGDQSLFDFRSIHASKVMAFKGNVEIEDFRFDINDDGRMFTLENVLNVDGFGGVYIGNFNMEDNTFRVYMNSSVVTLSKINYVTISKVNIKNNVIQPIAIYPIFVLEAVSFVGISKLNFSSNEVALLGGSSGNLLFELRKIDHLDISNHDILNNTFQHQPTRIIAMLPYRDGVAESDLYLVMKNVTFANNSVVTLSVPVTYLKCDGHVLHAWEVENFTVSQNTVSGRLLDFHTYSINSKYTSDMKIPPPPERSLKGVQIVNNPDMSDFSFLYFSPSSYLSDSDECILFAVQDKFTFSDFEIVNNSFSKGNTSIWAYEPSLLQVRQSSVGFINLTMQNNAFDTYNFLSLDHKPSSFILNASSITDTTFTSCQFLASNYLKGYTCATIGSKVSTLPTLLYRFAFILDSTFSKLQLNSSDFINLNNGFVSVKNTTFKDLNITESSTLISNKFYPLPLLPHKTAYARDISSETPIFQAFPELWRAYNETMNRVDPEAAYFCSFYENRFENLILANSSLISLEKFQLNPTFIEIGKNQFDEITASHISFFVELIGFSNLQVTQNTFTHLEGKIKAISITPHSGSKTLNFSNNKLQFAEILSFLSYSGKNLKALAFNQNEFLDSHYKLGGISLDVDTTAGDWMIENNHFDNNTMEFEGGSLEVSAFLLIKTKSAQPSNKITLQNNIFQLLDVSIGYFGFQDSLVSAFSINTFQNVYFKNNSISESFALVSGGLMEINIPKGGFYIQDSEFKDILSYYSKSIIIFTAAQFSVNNSKFTQMETTGETGLFSQTATSSNSLVQILNSKFDKIFSTSYGALLTSRSSSIMRTIPPEFGINLQIDNCTMTNFENEEVFSLHNLMCSSCVIKNSLLQMYQAKEKSNLKNSFFFEKVFGSLDINNVEFELPQNAPVSLIQVINSTAFTVTLRGIHYDGFISRKKCTLLNLITLDSGTFAIQDSLFENIFLDKYPLVNVVPNANSPSLWANKPTVSFDNASFSRISSKADGGVSAHIYLSNAIVYDYSIGAKPLMKSLIFSALPTYFKIQNSTFSEMTELSVLMLGHFENLNDPRYNSVVDIFTSNFRNNSADLGPAITVLPKSYNPSIFITDSVFESNDAETTGTLTIYNSKLILRNSIFKRNIATIGPAIFMGTKIGQTYTLTNNTYEENLAFYTQDIRFEAVDFRIDFIPTKSSRIVPSPTLEGNASLVLLNVSDYEMQQGVLQITFLDASGNPTPDFSISRQASFDLPMNAKSKSQVSFNAYMEDCHDDSCYLTLHNLLMTGFVGQNVSLNLRFTSETMDKYKSIQLNFRSCVAGEHQNGDTCTPCVAPTFSIDPTQPCSTCPTNADCPGQSKICPRPGFWNPSSLSTNVMECRDDEIARCSHDNGCGSCATGYAGPFCETCDFKNSYIETGYLKCGLCENSSKSLIISFMFSIFYSIYQIISIYIVYSGNKKILDDDIDHTLEKQKVARSFYMKVFLTYTQLMSVLYMGTSSVLKSIGVTSQIGNPAALVTYGTQCSMQALGIDYRDYFYYQTYVIISSPFTQLFIVLFGFLIVKIFSRSIRIREIGLVAFLYLIISFQPGIVANLAQFLTCRKVEGVEHPFVASHAYWTCDHPMYLSISKYIAIPSLLLWCFIVPLIIFAILFFKRKQLQTQEMTTLVGFFMKDVKVQHYYWGVFLMLMKLSLSFFIYSGNKDAEIQICISLLIIWGYQALLRSKKPYKEDVFNQLEILLMNLLMFNVIAVKYLINPSNGELVSKVSIGVVLTLNGGFISYMGYKILPLTFLAIKNFFFKPAKTELKQSLLEDKNDTLQL